MDAIKYFKEAVRMCKSSSGCENCLFNKGFDEYPVFPCRSSLSCKERVAIEECVSIVEKWSAEHPMKTRQSEFLKMFPNADIRNGIILICPRKIDQNSITSEECKELACSECQKKYWFAEVE